MKKFGDVMTGLLAAFVGLPLLIGTLYAIFASATTDVVKSAPEPVHRDQYGNLVAEQSDEGFKWVYSGPYQKIDLTRAAFHTILHSCSKISSNIMHFSKITASYVEMTDKETLGDLPDLKMVMVGLDFPVGSINIPGLPDIGDAAFILAGGRSHGITTNAIGAWFCNVSPPRLGHRYVLISAPAPKGL